MKLRTKVGDVDFEVTDRSDGSKWIVDPRDYLTRRQYRKMSTRPQMIRTFARHLADELAADGHPDVEVRALAEASLNGRDWQPLMQGKAIWKRRLTRDKWLKALLKTVGPDCEVGMEACAGAHHWARELSARGYRVKIIPPQFVSPYVKSNKNDANDAEAICEAMSRPSMRFVKPKTVNQQSCGVTAVGSKML